MKVAKFSSTDKKDLIENHEFGYCSLVKATKSILDRMEVENTVKTKVEFKGRTETPLVDKAALKEAIINAVVHNDYSREIPPVVMMYSDRIEVTSMGGLPYYITQEEFFGGASRPVNKEIMRIFRDLDLVEQLGTGITKITEVYGKEAFRFNSDNIITVLPFSEEINYGIKGKIKGKINGKINVPLGKIAEKTILMRSE